MSAPSAWSTPRTAIVTGGGAGIGAAISRRLGAEGAATAVFDLDGETAAAVAGEIVGAGGTALGLTVDVADRDAIESAVAEVGEHMGPPTILVNNAGLTPFKKFLEIEREEYDQVMAVNLRGTWDMCQVVIPHMVAAGWGRIVNIASSSAQTGSARQTHYSATKGGMIALSRSLAQEFGRNGITVNVVPPSFIETPSLHAADESGMLDIEAFAKMIPVRRVGQPDDIAAACAYLARDDAGFVTGQVLGVNGGRVMN